MAEIVTIARPYAQALFQLACETHTLPFWSAVLDTLSAVANNPEMVRANHHPRIKPEHIQPVFMEILDHQIPSSEKTAELGLEIGRFIAIILAYRRVSILPMIAVLFEAYRKEAEAHIDVQIESAFSLTDMQIAALCQDLSREIKCEICIQTLVNPDLIGGVRITIADMVIDASVRGKLSRLATSLKN